MHHMQFLSLSQQCPGTHGNTGFLQVRENWKKSGNLSGQGKVRGIFLEKSGNSTVEDLLA